MIWSHKGLHYKGLPCLIAAIGLHPGIIAHHLDMHGHLGRLGIRPVSQRRTRA